MTRTTPYPLNKLFIGSFIILAIYMLSISIIEIHYEKTPVPTHMSSPSTSATKLKVAIVVNTNTLGEREIAQRYKIAAEQLGWDAYEIRYNAKLEKYWLPAQIIKIYIGILDYIFAPDFYLTLLPSYYEIFPKNKPRYLKNMGNVDKNIMQILANLDKHEQFLDYYRYLGDYDGFVETDPNQKSLNKDTLTKLSHDHLEKDWDIIYGNPSTFKTPFIKLNYQSLFYCGDNWDAYRSSEKFHSIWKQLEAKGYLSVYGPPYRWSFLGSAYKGFAPLDGYSLIQRMQDVGIVLVIHNKFHLDKKIPSGRIFEAAASSSLIISDENEFVKKEFGDCVNYVDFSQDAATITNNIEKIVIWARENHTKAQKQAKCAHDIFVNKFTLEATLATLADKLTD